MISDGEVWLRKIIAEKLKIINETIEDLEKCKCGIKSHEFKVIKLIEKWKRRKWDLIGDHKDGYSLIVSKEGKRNREKY